jgi:aminopeptidase N
MTLKTSNTSKVFRFFPLFVLIFSTLLASPVSSKENPLIQHSLEVWLQPAKNQITVEDRITLPKSFSSDPGGKLYFMLHAGLNPISLTSGLELKRIDEKSNSQQLDKLLKLFSPYMGMDQEFFSLTLPSDQKTFSIKYHGEIYHPLNQDRGTPGTISSEGVFLSGASNWYPEFVDHFVVFKMKVHLSQNWDAVSQGERIEYGRNEKETRVVWESKSPQEEIFLLGNSFKYYSRKNSLTEAMVFLRQPDEALANKYLGVTSQYIEMYGKLLGAYPYKKFALVENFWETGFGMPSFTLLGPRVIRFPFILHSSYPHEILHNWFGNGVYVDYEKGNWAEGLTAYLADHLIKEQRGKSADYRRGTLQKYTDYVSSQNDFPLVDFRSRHSSSTEAVGYGKSLMVFHMLRQKFGDELFIKSLNAFYEKRRFQSAGFDDLREIFEASSSTDLKDFFKRWVSVSGAPELKISETKVFQVNGNYKLKATLEQVQPGKPYPLRVPIAVTLDGEPQAYQTTLEMKDKIHEIELKLPAKPLRLDVDPEFDVFRRLARNEIPPALTQVFGADKVLMLLPTKEKSLIDSYNNLAELLSRSYSGGVEIKLDNQIEELPIDKTIWILGLENRFSSQFSSGLRDYGATLGSLEASIADKRLTRKDHSFAITTRHPENPELGWAWVAIGNPQAFPGFARKLPHYHKYSYLVFEGGEPTNFVKWKWPVLNSPMTVFLSEGEGKKPEIGKLLSRKALAYLPPPLSE